MMSFTDGWKFWSFFPFSAGIGALSICTFTYRCVYIYTYTHALPPCFRYEESWANFAGKTNLHVQAFKSLSYIDDCPGPEGWYRLLPCSIAWSYCSILQSCLLYKNVTDTSLTFPLPFCLFSLSSHCQCLSLCALSGKGMWAAAVKGDEMEEAGSGGSYCCQVTAVPLAGGLGCGGSPLLLGWLLRQCPLGSWQPGASCGHWSSSCVTSWPALCQSSKRLGANNGEFSP